MSELNREYRQEKYACWLVEAAEPAITGRYYVISSPTGWKSFCGKKGILNKDINLNYNINSFIIKYTIIKTLNISDTIIDYITSPDIELKTLGTELFFKKYKEYPPLKENST